jgi:hypothetical protein
MKFTANPQRRQIGGKLKIILYATVAFAALVDNISGLRQ